VASVFSRHALISPMISFRLASVLADIISWLFPSCPAFLLSGFLRRFLFQPAGVPSFVPAL
jgi:hypothetical protein